MIFVSKTLAAYKRVSLGVQTELTKEIPRILTCQANAKMNIEWKNKSLKSFTILAHQLCYQSPFEHERRLFVSLPFSDPS